MRTYESLLKEGTEILRNSDISEARLDAWLLLEFAADISRAWYFAHPDEKAEDSVSENYLQLIKKRAEHVPLQHLTHQAFFMGYEFYVDERVLVPRQDTEILVETALEYLKEIRHPHILDMCTGSGCILLSLLLEKEGSTGTGADLSADALIVAGENAKRLGVTDRCKLIESNLFSSDFFCEKDGKAAVFYDMLVSNPPYIPTAVIDGLMEEVRLHDPRMALDGREDGLYFYRAISGEAVHYLKPGGILMFEIGYDQGSLVSQILTDHGFRNVKVIQDLAGLDRVVIGQLS